MVKPIGGVFLRIKLAAVFLGFSLGFACSATHYKQTLRPDTKPQNPTTKPPIIDPIGTISTTIPVTHSRDASTYIWATRHQEVLSLNKLRRPKIVFIGNSILHYWGGEPVSKITRGAGSWNEYFRPKDVRNLGFGFDRIENTLWRVHNGELDGFNASHIIILIGTNNLAINTDAEIIEGLKFLVQSVGRHQPLARIVLFGILPRRNYEARILKLNVNIAGVAASLKVHYASASNLFLDENQNIDEKLFSDGVHPNTQGYQILAPFINDFLN